MPCQKLGRCVNSKPKSVTCNAVENRSGCIDFAEKETASLVF
jgi:hypothetical protein